MVKDLGRAIWVTVTLTSTPLMDLISSLQLIRVSPLLPEALEMFLRTHQSVYWVSDVVHNMEQSYSLLF